VNRARTALGMSLEDLARLLDLNEGRLGDLEAGRHAPTSILRSWLDAGWRLRAINDSLRRPESHSARRWSA